MKVIAPVFSGLRYVLETFVLCGKVNLSYMSSNDLIIFYTKSIPDSF